MCKDSHVCACVRMSMFACAQRVYASVLCLQACFVFVCASGWVRLCMDAWRACECGCMFACSCACLRACASVVLACVYSMCVCVYVCACTIACAKHVFVHPKFRVQAFYSLGGSASAGAGP